MFLRAILNKYFIIFFLVIGVIVFYATVYKDFIQARLTEFRGQTVTFKPVIPAGWNVYENVDLYYSYAYPLEFTRDMSGSYSAQLYRNATTPSASTVNFIYFSVVPKSNTPQDGEIYNFSSRDYEVLMDMNIGEERSFSAESGLVEYFTYARLPDTTLGGYIARAFENEKPWEFPAGTKEIRYIVDRPEYIYVIGGYIETSSEPQRFITRPLFDQVMASVWIQK